MYEYINHVLANYFNTSVGHSEDEAILILRNNLGNSAEFAKGLHADLKKAFDDREYSWKSVFEEYDVFFTDSEEEARSYAKKILWSALFEK